jgi:hypothetical protein
LESFDYWACATIDLSFWKPPEALREVRFADRRSKHGWDDDSHLEPAITGSSDMGHQSHFVASLCSTRTVKKRRFARELRGNNHLGK